MNQLVRLVIILTTEYFDLQQNFVIIVLIKYLNVTFLMIILHKINFPGIDFTIHVTDIEAFNAGANAL